MKKYDVIIIGAGPSGIFCAYELIENNKNLNILMIEKGRPIEKRNCPKRKTKKCVGCQPCSITTGFAGAGAFSDGKLSLSPDVGGNLPEILGYDKTIELIKESDSIYLKFGADTKVYGIDKAKEITEIRRKAINANLKLIECPIRHLGTEEGYKIYSKLQEHLLSAGIEMIFNTMVDDIIIEDNVAKGVILDDGRQFFGDEIDRIREFDVLTGKIIGDRKHVSITPASHFAASQETIDKAINVIEYELEERLKELTSQDKLVEAQRLRQRTNYDIEMIKEMGYCSGIENYSRILDGRAPGTPPQTLLDYFPDDFLMFIDESHVTLPQCRAMYAGDRSRKNTLVDYGFRLPCAYDNRPLKFSEFEKKMNQVVFVSATPAQYELDNSTNIAEQVIRPTGLLDPVIEIRPVKGQIDDLYAEIKKTTEKGFRTLITTLTKRMAEDLTKYLKDLGIKTTYMHSDIETIERMKTIRDLRLGEFDVLVGINLLREGLDIPEVALVAILDADKEGFLRSETSLVQTIGRAARNSESRVIMYADTITKSMDKAIKETERRRKIQIEYNERNGITPQTIIKDVREVIEATKVAEEKVEYSTENIKEVSEKDKKKLIKKYTEEMMEAAKNLQFERAAELRDIINDLKGKK